MTSEDTAGKYVTLALVFSFVSEKSIEKPYVNARHRYLRLLVFGKEFLESFMCLLVIVTNLYFTRIVALSISSFMFTQINCVVNKSWET